MAFMFLRETIDTQNVRDSSVWLFSGIYFFYLCAQKYIRGKPERACLGVPRYVSGCFSPHFECLSSQPNGRPVVD